MADVAKTQARNSTPKRPWEFWSAASTETNVPSATRSSRPTVARSSGRSQLNQSIQEAVHQRPAGELRVVDRSGIALGDKVIQVRNRPPSNPIWAYCWSKHEPERG